MAINTSDNINLSTLVPQETLGTRTPPYSLDRTTISRHLEQIHRCGVDVYTTALCSNCGYQQPLYYSCRLRYCQRCTGISFNRLYRHYYKEFHNQKYKALITLTVGKIPYLSQEIIHYWRKQLVKLLHRHIFKNNLKGAIYAFEVSENWHLHIHLIASLKCFIPQSLISKNWAEVSGRYVVDIRAIRSSHALGYVLGYSAKVPKFSHILDFEAYHTLFEGIRKYGSFGCFFGLPKVKFKARCPICKEKGCFIVDRHLLHILDEVQYDNYIREYKSKPPDTRQKKFGIVEHRNIYLVAGEYRYGGNVESIYFAPEPRES